MLQAFIHIGPGRTGTTMLYEAFFEHPDICMPVIKETNYFLNQRDTDLSRYQSFFAHCESTSVVGEISNQYFYDPRVPQRIAECLPDVRIITVLRNPFERIRSVYHFMKRDGTLDQGTSMKRTLETHPELIGQNYYGDILKRYLKYFSLDKVLIAFYDDLKRDPEEFIRSILGFIGVDASFVPEAIYRHINPSVSSRFPWLTSAAYRIADGLRRWQLYSLLNSAKRSPAVRHILFRPDRHPDSRVAPSQHTSEALANHFVPQIKEVEQITGRDLSEWYSEYV